MKIYTSTGGFGSRTFYESANQLIDVGCKYIELSSGAHVSDPKKLLTILNSRSEIMLHNYFPPPQDPFVINLGSDNPDILSRSVSLVMSAIDISSDLGLKVYGVHSGFRLNLKVEDLGQIRNNHSLISKKKANDTFMSTISKLGRYAAKRNVFLLIENNILTKTNFSTFGTNPFLMVDPIEIRNTLESLDCEIGLLLDLAHLKVSSNTLRFSLQEAMVYLNPLVFGYQASENDGLGDSGLPFDESAWFMHLIDTTKNFLTLELCSSDPSVYRDMELKLSTLLR